MKERIKVWSIGERYPQLILTSTMNGKMRNEGNTFLGELEAQWILTIENGCSFYLTIY